MYQLSNLPIEILLLASSFLGIEDLIRLARLNTWFSYTLSSILSERIQNDVKKELYRIHIDALTKQELLMLGDFSRINPYTLDIEFDLHPIDDDGIDTVKGAADSQRSLLLNDASMNISAYFTKMTETKKLQHVHEINESLLSNQDLIENGTIRMSTNFEIKYSITKDENETPMILFKKAIVTPEWWLDQLKVVTSNDYCQHLFLNQ